MHNIFKFGQILFMRYIILFFLFISSCSSKKDIILIQDSKLLSNYNFEFKNIKIQADDILRTKFPPGQLISLPYTMKIK